MTTEAKKETPIVEYRPTEAAIAKLRQDYEGVVFQVETKEGMGAARRARADLRDLRVALEKQRQELKADLLSRGRIIDGEAKRITTALEAMEEPIDQQIKKEERRIEEERTRAAREAAEKVAREEAERKAAEQARLKAEAERLAQERAEFERAKAEQAAKEKAERDAREAEDRERRKEEDRRRAELRAEEDRLAAERRRLEEARLAQEREAEAKAAAERRAQEEEARAIRLAKEIAEREAREKAEAAERKAASDRVEREVLLRLFPEDLLSWHELAEELKTTSDKAARTYRIIRHAVLADFDERRAMENAGVIQPAAK